MIKFCSDIDILKYEPALFGELHLTNQVMVMGSDGEIAGTTFTSNSADFESAGVEPGGVIYLRSADGVLDGAYEIVEVDSATRLCVSVVRDDSEADPIAAAAASDISYRISTLRPQAAEVSIGLTKYLGLQPGRPESDVSAADILDAEVLKEVCAFGVVSTAYADDGLVSLKSPHNVNTTANRLENILKQKGMTVFIRIDHAEGAQKVGRDLRPTELIIFGNPKVGTPLMQCRQCVAIDLPQKALIWEDAQGQVWLSYNDPNYLVNRHRITGCSEVVKKIQSALSNFAQKAL